MTNYSKVRVNHLEAEAANECHIHAPGELSRWIYEADYLRRFKDVDSLPNCQLREDGLATMAMMYREFLKDRS